MRVVLITFCGSKTTTNVYPTKAEFVATMQQLHGDKATYRSMEGSPTSIDDLTAGQLWVSGEYVGFWCMEPTR